MVSAPAVGELRHRGVVSCDLLGASGKRSCATELERFNPDDGGYPGQPAQLNEFQADRPAADLLRAMHGSKNFTRACARALHR